MTFGKTKTMVLAGVGTLALMGVAKAQDPEAAQPTKTNTTTTTDTTTTISPTAPSADVPPETPDVDEPVSPAAPVHPGETPAMASPNALPPPAPIENVEGTTSYPVWMNRVGAAFMLGGGFEDFTHTNVRSVTGQGGSWDVRLAAGTRQVIGIEAAYVGAARSIQTLGLQNDTVLVSNGVEGDLRLNIPIAAGWSLVEPFGFVGIGWQHYSLNKTAPTADVAGSDDIMTVPYGGGLEASFRRFLIDARFTARQTYRNDLFRNGTMGNGSGTLNTWGISGNLGVEF
jgi:hypothetical protein